ncbi:hypothetical protein FOHLNKBM_2208 [Methylobacterium longum]|nr:hypothetical protein FOHLNKBM_2208 [Methylobacterium longum]
MGTELPAAQAARLAAMRRSTLPECRVGARRALLARRQAGTFSTSKLGP